MKRLLSFAAAATVLFAACQKTEVVYDNPDPQEIALFAVNKVATKAPVGGTAFPTDDKMQVAAYLAHGGVAVGDYFGKTEFSKNGAYWTGGKYWPVTASTINFLAVSEPVSGTTVVTTFPETNSAASASVVLSGNDTAQYDLMYAVGQGKCAPSSYSEVDMQFRHALTWLYFKVKSNVSGVVTVNSITVKDTAVDGTLSIDNGSNYNATADVTSSTATIGASWSPGATGDRTVVAAAVDCTTSEQDFGSLLVLPTVSGTKSFVINYTITNGGDTTTFNYTYSTTAEWKMAYKYTYNVNITLTGIDVNPVVSTWTTPAGTAVPLG